MGVYTFFSNSGFAGRIELRPSRPAENLLDIQNGKVHIAALIRIVHLCAFNNDCVGG